MMISKRKIGLILSYVMKLLILIYTGYSFINGQYFMGFVGIFSFFVTFIPSLLYRTLRVTLPWELSFLMVLSLFLHVAGNVGEFYDLFYPIYDKIAHFVSSVTVAVLGLVSAVILDQYTDTNLNKYMIMVFVVLLTMAFGAFWEIGEFLYDLLLGTQTQPGLKDTMFDLIFDLAGGIIIGVLGYVYHEKIPRRHFL
ncbi:MAG: hypothetical protein HXS53_01060 [Theionarchaea archaeon]|nr:hypothetical protein [Theionarchaea archaeon]